MKVAWGGVAECNLTWELESRMRESYLELFVSGNIFEDENFLVGESCNAPVFICFI